MNTAFTYYYLLIYTLLILIPGPDRLNAQSFTEFSSENNAVFEVDYINVIDGLDSRHVIDLAKDDNGFLWIGTNNGFNRYDGFDIRQYTDVGRIRNIKFFKEFYTSPDGNIWCFFIRYSERTVSQNKFRTLYSYLPHLNLENFTNDIGNLTSLDSLVREHNFEQVDIFTIQNNKSHFLLRLSDGRVFKFDGELQYIQNIESRLCRLGLDNDGHLMLFDNHGYEIVDSLQNTISYFKYEVDFLCKATYVDDDDNIWILGQQGNEMYIYLINKSGFHTLDSFFLDQTYIHHISDIVVEKYEDYTFVKIHDRLYHYKELNIQPIQDLIPEIKKDIHVQNIFKDDNCFYICTDDGYYTIRKRKERFRTLLNEEQSKISSRKITRVEDKLYVNSYKGLITVDTFPSENVSGLKISSDIGVGMFYDDQNKTLYYGSHRSQLKCYKLSDSLNSASRIYEINLDNGNARDILNITKSKLTGKIWVASSQGLYREELKGIFNKIPFQITDDPEQSPYFNATIEVDSFLYISSCYGLLKLNQYDHSYRFYNRENSSLPTNYYSNIYYENDSSIWLCSIDKGLVLFNPVMDKVEIYDMSAGLSFNNVHAALPQGKYLWVSTNHGLNRLDKKTKNITQYFEADGISHNEFNRFSYFQDSDSTIYFGGINGLTVIDPENHSGIEDTLYVNSLELTISEKGSGNRTAIVSDSHKKILLDSRERQLSISIIPNVLINSDNINFYYSLDTQDENWELSPVNKISFNQLAYGEHILKIMLRKPGFESSPEAFTLILEVEKPYYLSSGFKVFIIVLIIFLTSLVVMVRNWYFRQKAKKLEAIIAARTAELETSNKIKDKLFSIIAHDLRAPLNALNNLNQKIEYLLAHDQIQRALQLSKDVDISVNRINDSLNNLLIWSLAEQNSIPYNPVDISVEETINYAVDLYKNNLVERKLNIETDSELKSNVKADETAVQTIFRNLIHNAIKYSSEESTIRITSRQLNSEFCEIEVSNNYNEDLENKVKGFGIGLKIVKELVKINKGSFDLIKDNHGVTKASLKLPLSA